MLSLLARIFINNVLPVFAIMALGIYLDRGLHLDKKSLSRMAVYVLTPAFVFNSIVKSAVAPRDFGIMLLYVIVITLLMCVIGLAVGKLLHWSRRTTDALILSIAFLNSGNFGLSVVLFSYGQQGLELGTVFFVGTNLAANTLAAFFASHGPGSTRRALRNVARLPGPYAFCLALVIRALGVQLPEILMKPVGLVGQAAVPVMLMMLGVQLSQTHMGRRLKEISVAVAIRLVAGAVLGVVLAPLMGLHGLARQVGVVQAAMPTAVTSGLMAIEFDADAELVSSVIFWSTALSAVTLTVVIALMGA